MTIVIHTHCVYNVFARANMHNERRRARHARQKGVSMDKKVYSTELKGADDRAFRMFLINLGASYSTCGAGEYTYFSLHLTDDQAAKCAEFLNNL